MIFNDEHKVIINSLKKEEAEAFILFLKSEVVRHEDDIRQAKELINLVREMFFLCV